MNAGALAALMALCVGSCATAPPSEWTRPPRSAQRFESAWSASIRGDEYGRFGVLGELGGRRRLVVRPYIVVYRVVPKKLVQVVVHGARDLPALFAHGLNDSAEPLEVVATTCGKERGGDT